MKENSTERIVTIDVIRGFALLGLLTMNIMSFSMPGAAYYNPLVFHPENIWNHWVFGVSNILFDQKFMALFSLLFGASTMLILSKMEQKGKGGAKTYFVRNIWLLLFGLLHGIFIWEGDVLFIYALCSFVLYFFRRIPAKLQLTLGLIIFFSPSLIWFMSSSVLQEKGSEELVSVSKEFNPTRADLEEETAVFQGDYFQQLEYRLGIDEIGWDETEMNDENVSDELTALDISEFSMLYDVFARAFGMMLAGMALFKWGFISGKAPPQSYRYLLRATMPIGLAIGAYGLSLNYSNNWYVLFSFFEGRIPNLLATALLSIAYIALLVLWSKSSWGTALQSRLAAVGQMALSNYIAQSILSTSIFYGFGLGLYGQVNRPQQLLIVLLVWVFQIQLSHWWMKHFQFGPLEWIWRALTHFHFPAIRRISSIKVSGEYPKSNAR